MIVEGMLFPASYLAPQFSPAEEERMEAQERDDEAWWDEHHHLLELVPDTDPSPPMTGYGPS